MRRNKDPRINAGYMSIKDYLIMLLTLSAISGFHMWIYQVLQQSGLMETNIRLSINLLMMYIMITAAIFLAGIAIVRHVIWNRPMRTFSQAAKKIALGDFTVRIPPLRKDGKKDFIEVMFDDFNTMAEELATIETLKDDFIGNVSHEIKTPLSVIQSYATALQKENLSTEERKEYTEIIIEATQKLTAMVTNILKLNKLENQEILPEPESFDLSEQLRQCAVSFEELWEQKNIGFEADLDEITVCYDTHMLEIVWNNLLSNAVKFTNPWGEIKISLKAQSTPESGNLAVVMVTDTGIGIDKDAQKHIFDKFYQGDTSHAQEGNGLGLALVKKTVDLLGGTIKVDSESGYGTTFTVFLKI